jgi:hypothetical protein
MAELLQLAAPQGRDIQASLPTREAGILQQQQHIMVCGNAIHQTGYTIGTL